MEEAKNRFEIERKLDDNSKAFGQPVISNMESILYDNGIYKIVAFVGAIDVNYCRRLISNAESIFEKIIYFVLSSYSRIYEINDHQIK